MITISLIILMKPLAYEPLGHQLKGSVGRCITTIRWICSPDITRQIFHEPSR